MSVYRAFVAMIVMLFFMPLVAYAADVVAVDDGGVIAMIVGALPALIEVSPAWVGVVIGVVCAVCRIITMLPDSITFNWPKWLKSLIKFLALSSISIKRGKKNG